MGSWLKASAPYVIAPVELILVLYKEDWKKTSGSGISDMTKDEFMEWTNGLWTFPGESKKRIGHPASFPLELPHSLMIYRVCKRYPSRSYRSAKNGEDAVRA